MAPALSTMTRLTSLYLGNNGLEAAAAASLAPSLASMTQLTSLYLEDNAVGAAGAASLSPALARMTRLKLLDLDSSLSLFCDSLVSRGGACLQGL